MKATLLGIALLTTTPTVADTLTCEVTAYCQRGTTRSGTPAGPGVCAVDPRVIPLGSRVWVPGYGWARAEDTGGAVKGRVVDVWIADRAKCLRWGRKVLKVQVLRRGESL